MWSPNLVHMSKCAHVSMFTCALGKMKALQLPPGGQSAATPVSPPLKGTIERLSWPSSKAVTEIGRGMRAGASRVVRGRQLRGVGRLRAGDAAEVYRRDGSDHVSGVAGQHIGHAAPVRASARVDALGIDAGVGLQPFDHVARELNVVDLVCLSAVAAVAHVPAVSTVRRRVGENGYTAHAVALRVPSRTPTPARSRCRRAGGNRILPAAVQSACCSAGGGQ